MARNEIVARPRCRVVYFNLPFGSSCLFGSLLFLLYSILVACNQASSRVGSESLAAALPFSDASALGEDDDERGRVLIVILMRSSSTILQERKTGCHGERYHARAVLQDASLFKTLTQVLRVLLRFFHLFWSSLGDVLCAHGTNLFPLQFFRGRFATWDESIAEIVEDAQRVPSASLK